MQNNLHLRPLAEQLDKNPTHQLHRQVQLCQQLRHQSEKKELSELQDFKSLISNMQKSRKTKLIVVFEYISEKKICIWFSVLHIL